MRTNVMGGVGSFARAANRQQRRERAAVLIFFIPVTVIVGLLAVGFVVIALASRRGLDVVFSLVLVGAGLLLVRGTVREAGRERPVRIVPYVEVPVGVMDGYFRGHALASSIEWLDSAATRAGVTPLTAFGFADDAFGERVVWRPAGDGLRTLSALLDKLSAEATSTYRLDLSGEAGVDLRKDLMAIQHVFQEAGRRGAGVALLVLSGVVAGPIIKHPSRRGFLS